MQTSTHEIAANIFKIRTDIPGDEPFSFNQFLIRADEPMLYHTGPKKIFPAVSTAVSTLIGLEDLKWIAFGHFEDDECGALNAWQQLAPNAGCVCLELLAITSLDGFANKAVKVIGKGEGKLDLGSHRVTLFATPHFTHAWESQMLFEEVTGTLFSGDFGTQVGTPSIIANSATMNAIKEAETHFESTHVSPLTLQTIKRLSSMPINTLAIMHGASITEGVRPALEELYDFYESILRRNLAELEC
ncbi:MAG: MBL fold metallo-hydrolase [Pseudomonadota bacterium]